MYTALLIIIFALAALMLVGAYRFLCYLHPEKVVVPVGQAQSYCIDATVREILRNPPPAAPDIFPNIVPR